MIIPSEILSSYFFESSSSQNLCPAQILLPRDLASSWNDCMESTVCKWCAIAGIVVGVIAGKFFYILFLFNLLLSF